MKATFSLLLLLVLCSIGCEKKSNLLEQWIQSNNKIKVLSTTTIIDDLVGQIGGDHIDHIPLIQGDIDPHSYELVKGDDEKLSYAQIIFYNGLGLEHGASLRYRLENNPQAYSLGGFIHEKYPDLILYENNQIDPHIWLDLSLWTTTIELIVEKLILIDPVHQEDYQKNGQRVKETLLKLDQNLQNRLDKIAPEKKYLVTSHSAFNYFARRYLSKQDSNWKDHVCSPEGIAPDGQLSCHDIQTVVDYIKKNHIETLFCESNVGKDSLNKVVSVCLEQGLKIRIYEACLYSDTLGGYGSNYETYYKMMEHNVTILCKAWE